MLKNREKFTLRRGRTRGRVKKHNPGRSRLTVFRSEKHIYAQVIDDVANVTLVSASTLDGEIKGKIKSGANREAAAEVGKLIAARAKAAGIETVVFDRGAYIYHGRVKALADAAREGGLVF
jgi:large subunit ribosomal protein L18